jgi:hypothetical protein
MPTSRYESGLGERIGDLPSNEPDAWQKSITIYKFVIN